MKDIAPFYVMEVLEEAFRMQAEGQDIIHLQMGEPDFDTPELIARAGIAAVEQKCTHYSQALGHPQLRALIADSYPASCRPQVSRIAITPGSSGALQIIFASLLEPGDRVMLADPGYPCNPNMIRIFGGEADAVPCDASNNYQLTARSIRQHWTDTTRAVLIASPSNPTGSIVSPQEVALIAETVRELGGVLIVDEIYHGLVYETSIESALHNGNDIYVINSFSKFYGMTGWRLGWIVMPENDNVIEDLTRLAQNLFICASTPAQYAAMRAFDSQTLEELERRRALFHARRDFFVPALRELGFIIPVDPQGAFYVYADCSAFTQDSDAFAKQLLKQALVGVAPGKDFGQYRRHEHIRFSYSNSMDNLCRAIDRMDQFIQR